MLFRSGQASGLKFDRLVLVDSVNSAKPTEVVQLKKYAIGVIGRDIVKGGVRFGCLSVFVCV